MRVVQSDRRHEVKGQDALDGTSPWQLEVSEIDAVNPATLLYPEQVAARKGGGLGQGKLGDEQQMISQKFQKVCRI